MSIPNEQKEQKLVPKGIPGAMNREQRFAKAEHAKDVGRTLKRIVVYFIRKRSMVLGMFLVVLFGTLCGVYAPSLQSRAIDIIAGERNGSLPQTLLFMLFVYLCYSMSGLLQGLFSAVSKG